MQFSKSTISIARLIPIILIIVGTVAGSWYVGDRVMNNEIGLLQIRAQNIAVSMPDESIMKLSGTKSDIGTTEYQDIKGKLVELHKINSDTRFVYLMGLSGDTQFFFADSENPDSKDYSPPGQIYTDAMPIDIANQKSGTAYTNGPYTDKWGTWISAYAPIFDKNTGAVVAMLGIDADAGSILNKALFSRINIIIIGIFLLLSVFFLVRVLQNLINHKSTLEEKNQDLETRNVYYEESQELAKLGQMNIFIPKEDITMNSFMAEILNCAPKTNISLSEFFKSIESVDANRIQNQFTLIKDNDRDKISFTYHVPKEGGKLNTVASICKIKRDAHGAPLRIICTAQDISEHIA